MRFKRILCLATLLALALTALPVIETPAQASAKYYITVDITNQVVTVYDNGNTSDSGIVRQMICSTGKTGTATPTGTFSLPSKTYATERTEWYYFPEFNCYAKWATRIYKGILFHSVLYSASKKGPTSSSVNALGSKASHGCVRLRVEDSKWIAQNCPAGTKCKIYNSGSVNADLRTRLLSKSFSRSSETYDHFMGRPEGTSATTVVKVNLSKGKKGAQVGQLQSRLRALGFYGGAVDNKFGSATKTAVNAFQVAIGQKKTGKVNTDLWNRIFADTAPTSTLATLTEGWQGPSVAVLQRALSDMKLFSGAVDGNFGADTVAAVNRYQQGFNLTVNGQADSALQDAAIRKAAEVKSRFAGAEYQLVESSHPVSMATVNVKSYVKMRNKASKKGKSLVKLRKNYQVRVLEDLGDWVQVQYGKYTGYVQRGYLNFYTGTEYEVSYEPAPTPTPEPTPYLPGVEEAVLAAPAEEIDSGLTLEEVPEPTPAPTPEPEMTAEPEPTPEPDPTPLPTDEPAPEPVSEANRLPRYAVALNEGATLFAEASAEVEPLALLSRGAALEVVLADGEWIAVNYEGAMAWIAAADVLLTDELPGATEAGEPALAQEAAGEPEVTVEFGTEPAETAGPAVEENNDGLVLEDEAEAQP